MHSSIQSQVTVHTEPSAQDENELELLWLHLTVKQRKRAAVRACMASTYMPNSAKPDSVITTAWDALEDAVVAKAATAGGHCVLMGDLNARLPPAPAPGGRYGYYGEPADAVKPGAGAWKAGERLLQAMEQLDLYSLAGRAPPAVATDAFTYATQEGTADAKYSVLDYVLVGKQLFADGARGEVHDSSAWEIAGSPHRVVGAWLPLTVHRDASTKPKPFWKWRVEKFTDKEGGAEVRQAYRDALEASLPHVERAAAAWGVEP